MVYLYFVALVVLGNLVLLNLFLAILINNFTYNRQKEITIKNNVLTFSLRKLLDQIQEYWKERRKISPKNTSQSKLEKEENEKKQDVLE